MISGTPTAAGTATFIVKAKNHNGLDTKTLSITIAEAAEFIVTFDENGGTPSVGSMTTTNQKLSSLPSVSRSNYSFDGWFTDKDGGEKVTEATEFSKNTIVYAHWTYIGGSGGGGGSRKQHPPQPDKIRSDSAWAYLYRLVQRPKPDKSDFRGFSDEKYDRIRRLARG